MCSLEPTILWISAYYYLLRGICDIPSDSSIRTSTRKVIMIRNAIDYSFVIFPLGLLAVLGFGSYNHSSTINSLIQVHKDKNRAQVVPDIHSLRQVADTLSRDARVYGQVLLGGHNYQNEANVALQALVVARDHADAVLRQQRWWRHLFAPS